MFSKLLNSENLDIFAKIRLLNFFRKLCPGQRSTIFLDTQTMANKCFLLKTQFLAGFSARIVGFQRFLDIFDLFRDFLAILT